MTDSLNAVALEKRSTLPPHNSFTITELTNMPPYFGWVECSSGSSTFRMLLGGADDGIALRFLWNGSYESMSLKSWTWLAKKVELAIDVGAHTGTYTLAARAANPNVLVLSFEPHFMNFARLNLNLRANGFGTGNTFMYAVGAKNEVLPFSVSTSLDWLSSGGSIGKRQKGITTSVQVINLDSFLTPPVVAKVGLVKIDTEGFEAECIQGMRNIISTKHPVIFFECIDAKSGSEVQNILQEYGYKFYEVDDNEQTIAAVATIKPSLDSNGKPIYGRFNRIASTSDIVEQMLRELR
jgi:FkbM family methyltransferase